MSTSLPPVINRFEEGDDHVLADESQLPFAHVEILGSGHSGVVEKVVNVTTGRDFARKKMAIRSKSARAETERIFRNEINIIRGLERHHHIIRVFASYMAKREIGLILEPVADEGDLSSFLEHVEEVREANIFDPRLARLLPIIDRAFGCLASGLAFMHRKRIRHKDIKPQNVLIYRGSVLYTDFGYSLKSDQFSHSTTEGQPDSLTRRYAAPEVLSNGERNSSSDTFSLGCVYLELLSVTSDNPDLTPNMETFSGDLDLIHQCLLEAQLPQRLAFLRSIIILMTARDRQSRPKASQVSKEIMRYSALCCPACRALDEPESDIDTELSFATSEALPKSDAPKGTTLSTVPTLPSRLDPKAQPWSPTLDGSVDQSKLNTGPEDAAPVPRWSSQHQRYLISVWHHQDQKYCRRHYVKGQGWVLFDWDAQDRNTVQPFVMPKVQSEFSRATAHKRKGSWPDTFPNPNSGREHTFPIPPSYVSENMMYAQPPKYASGFSSGHVVHTSPQHGESLGHSFSVQQRAFFEEGRVFAVLFSEPAGANGLAQKPGFTTNQYNELVLTQIRRFIVVQQKWEFCFAVPIFTYSGKATTKPGVKASEHAIAYSWGSQPQLVAGETHMTSIPIKMAAGVAPLSPASRIYFGIHHPIQYNIKVKDLGQVHPDSLYVVLGIWKSINGSMTMQPAGLEDMEEEDDNDEGG